MIINGNGLLHAKPLYPMEETKKKFDGFSYGMSEAGYDIRINEDIIFEPEEIRWFGMRTIPAQIHRLKSGAGEFDPVITGKFCLASTFEKFFMPDGMVGIVHDKSTWARRGLSVFNTVIEPGWSGYLTLELVFNGTERIHIRRGTGIAQVIFHMTSENAHYNGKYQNAKLGPQEAILE